MRRPSTGWSTRARWWAPAPTDRALVDRTLPPQEQAAGLLLGVLLAGIAGATDVLGFLHLHLYVSFMSGNTTQFSLALGNGDLGSAARIGGVIGLFVAGAALGAVLVAAFGRWHIPGVLVAVALLLAVAGGWPGADLPGPALVATVLAMGALTAALERAGPVKLSLTYVTGTLAKLGHGLGRALVGQGGGWDGLRQAAPWLGLVAGAATGRLADIQLGRQALLVVAGCTLLVAGLAALMPRDWREDVA